MKKFRKKRLFKVSFANLSELSDKSILPFLPDTPWSQKRTKQSERAPLPSSSVGLFSHKGGNKKGGKVRATAVKIIFASE